MKNIFAYTEPTPPVTGYPSYLSVNHIDTEADRNIVFTVRSSGNSGATQEVRLTPAMCEALINALAAFTAGAELESTKTVDRAWSQFCGGIGRGPDAPYPGMIEAFEAHYGQAFTDKDWRNETGVWAAAWGHATRQAGEVHATKVDNRAAPATHHLSLSTEQSG